MDRSRYPADWEAVSRRVRDAAGNRCEWCGVANGARGYREGDGRFVVIEGDLPCRRRCIRIVLTVAHVHDPNPMNVEPSNLAALCQRCHLNWDRDHHVRNAAETRRRRKIAAGQMALA